MQAMVNVCSTNMWLKPAIAAIELAQMVVQGVWNEDSRLLQLPHFDKERSRGFEAEGVDNIFDFTEMEDATRSRLLEGLSEREVADVVEFCNEYPDIEVTAQLEATTVKTGSEGVLHVSLSAGEDGFDTAVRSQQFPQKLLAHCRCKSGDSLSASAVHRQRHTVFLAVRLNPAGCCRRICHVRLIQQQQTGLCPHHAIHFRIAAASGNSCIQNFHHGIHQRQIGSDHAPCLGHMPGKPLDVLH